MLDDFDEEKRLKLWEQVKERLVAPFYLIADPARYEQSRNHLDVKDVFLSQEFRNKRHLVVYTKESRAEQFVARIRQVAVEINEPRIDILWMATIPLGRLDTVGVCTTALLGGCMWAVIDPWFRDGVTVPLDELKDYLISLPAPGELN